MNKLMLLAGLLFTGALLSGHEFWMQPEKFIYRNGEKVKIKFMEGENFEGHNWNGTRTSVKNFRLYYANVMDDCVDQISETEKGDSVEVSFFEEGTMMFTLNLHPPNSARGEMIVHNAKTLVQVGSKFTTAFKRQTGLTLDIIPQENPYKLRDGEKFPIKMLFQGKPLANTTFTIWHRNNEQTVTTELRTNDKGEAEFPVFTYGGWMISTEKTVSIETTSPTKSQLYLGTLTFGYLR